MQNPGSGGGWALAGVVVPTGRP